MIWTEESTLDQFLTPSSDTEIVEQNHSYRLAGIYSFSNGMIDRGLVSGADIAYSKLRRLHEGQVVFARLNAWEGALSVVPPELSGAYVSNEYPAFDIDSSVDRRYISYILAWPDFWQRLTPRG